MATQHAATVAAKQELGITPSYKDAGVNKKIEKLARDYADAQRIEKAAKNDREELKAEILVELAKAGLNAKPGESVSVLVNEFKVNAILGKNSTINAELLLAAGVPADTIVECTSETTYEYVTVTDVPKKQIAAREKKAGVKSIAAPGRKSKR